MRSFSGVDLSSVAYRPESMFPLLFVTPLKYPHLIVTRSGKTSLIPAITDIHFLPVDESCTHALPRDTKYVAT